MAHLPTLARYNLQRRLVIQRCLLNFQILVQHHLLFNLSLIINLTLLLFIRVFDRSLEELLLSRNVFNFSLSEGCKKDKLVTTDSLLYYKREALLSIEGEVQVED